MAFRRSVANFRQLVNPLAVRRSPLLSTPVARLTKTSCFNIPTVSFSSLSPSNIATLTAISPIDGRYAKISKPLSTLFSEFALIRNRVIVEVRWLQFMANSGKFPELPSLSPEANTILDNIIANFSIEDAAQVKEIESVTRHDVKAVEYFLKKKVQDNAELATKAEFLHFACTSEDISNLAYAMMLRDAREQVISPKMQEIIDRLATMAVEHADKPMLCRTHGQPATPSTMGKEMGNFAVRLARQHKLFNAVPIFGKFNGAVGNYNAHISAYPDVDWQAMSRAFVEQSLGLTWAQYSTQIEVRHGHDEISLM